MIYSNSIALIFSFSRGIYFRKGIKSSYFLENTSSNTYGISYSVVSRSYNYLSTKIIYSYVTCCNHSLIPLYRLYTN